MIKLIRGLSYVAVALFALACTPGERQVARTVLEFTDEGCLVLHDVEPAPVQKLCDYEHEIKPYLEQRLASKGNRTIAAPLPAVTCLPPPPPVSSAPSAAPVPAPAPPPPAPPPAASSAAVPAASAPKKHK